MNINLTWFDLPLLARASSPADLCAVDISGGGGDSFECYDVEEDVVDTVLDRGTAFGGAWLYGANPLNNFAGDTFESYSVAANVSDNTLSGGANSAWDGSTWRSGPGKPTMIDDFESYLDGTYTSGNLANGVGLGAWQSES